MKKILLFLIIFFAFGLRLYQIETPLADWHSWRQADTAAVSRNFVNKGFDLLHPRYDDLSNVASGLENPEGYRFVEFPIYNFFQALAFKLEPALALEVWGRLISVFCSLGSLIFLYLLTKELVDQQTALLAAFFFAILPFNIYYSRVVLPEPMMLLASLGMVWFYYQWIKSNAKSWKNLSLAVLFAASSWLLKPFTLVLLLPITCLGWQQWQFNRRKHLLLFSSFAVSVLPFIAWRWWMGHFPEGIPYSAPLFNLTKIRFKGAFFWWLFAERIGKLILGVWGLIPFGLGLVAKTNKKESLFFYSWLGAILVYFVIVAGGNVQHDYYQYLAVPIICVFLAKGIKFILTLSTKASRPAAYTLAFVSSIFMLAFSWYQVRDYFNINNPAIIEAGAAVDRLLPPEAKVVAPYGGDTAFLYHTNRQGWPIGIQIEEFIKQGATHYVNVNFDEEVEWITGTYCVIEKTPNYVIVDLKQKCR